VRVCFGPFETPKFVEIVGFSRFWRGVELKKEGPRMIKKGGPDDPKREVQMI